MQSSKCFVDAVSVGKRLRSINPEKVAALAESIAAIGLHQPISVWSPDADTLDLVAGLHRLEAFKKLRRDLPDEADLRWDQIPCIFVDMEYLDRKLWEIDENLMRAELGPAEMAEHTAKRAELVRQKAEFLKLRKTESDPSKNAENGQGDFDEETAKSTGKSKSTVRRDKARGEAIPADVLGKIRGTELDTGVYLDKLKKLTRDEIRAKVDLELQTSKEGNFGKTKNVREVLPEVDNKQSDHIGGVNYDGLCRAWNACSEDEIGRFLIHISWDLPTWDLNRDLKKERADLKKALEKQKLKTKAAKTTETNVLAQLKALQDKLAQARDKQHTTNAEIELLSAGGASAQPRADPFPPKPWESKS